MLNAIHILGQILLGGYFVWSGVNHFIKHKDLTTYASSAKVPVPGIAVYLTGILMIVGGLGVLFNIYLLISLVILIVFLVPVTFIMHSFWKNTDIGIRQANVLQFSKNLALIGAILLLINW